jgi:tetratricopeptide (TPR) repeat protein
MRTSLAYRPTISLSMIVRNEEACIARAIGSVRPWVDEVVVVDTGSTDGTPGILRDLGVTVGTFAWCDDFAAARNAALDMCHGDWVLSLDADEELAEGSGPALQGLVSRQCDVPTVYSLLVRDANDIDGVTEWGSFHAARLFPRIPDLRWHGRVHEQILFADGGSPRLVPVDDVVIVHRGYLRETWEAKAKDERNLRLLMAAIDEDPGDPRRWHELARQHYAAGRYAEALDAAERCIGLCRKQGMLGMNYAAYALSFAVGACANIGRAERGIELGQEGIRLHPGFANLWANLGVCYQRAGRPNDALICYDRAMGQALQANAAYELDGALPRWRLASNAAEAYASLGELVRAAECYWQAIEGQPALPGPRLGLVRVLAALGETEMVRDEAAGIAERWPGLREQVEVLVEARSDGE